MIARSQAKRKHSYTSMNRIFGKTPLPATANDNICKIYRVSCLCKKVIIILLLWSLTLAIGNVSFNFWCISCCADSAGWDTTPCNTS